MRELATGTRARCFHFVFFPGKSRRGSFHATRGPSIHAARRCSIGFGADFHLATQVVWDAYNSFGVRIVESRTLTAVYRVFFVARMCHGLVVSRNLRSAGVSKTCRVCSPRAGWGEFVIMAMFHGVPTVDNCTEVSQWIVTESGADSRAELHLLCWKAGCDMGGADE